MKIDLTCPVELWQYAMPTEDDAECTFVMNNLSDKAVTSVQVTLACYDKEDMLLFRQTDRAQGLKAGVGERFSVLILPTQWQGVEGVDLVVEKVWFDDATIWRRTNTPLAVYTPNTLPNGRALDQLRFVAGKDAVGYPQEQEQVWVCVCGRANEKNSPRCCRCERRKDMVFTAFTRDNVSKCVAAHDNKLDEIAKKAREENSLLAEAREKQRTAERRRKLKLAKLAISGVSILAVVAVLLIWGLPTMRYNDANNKLKNGQYDEARAAFADMGSYRDAEDKLLDCDYREAESYLNKGDAESLNLARETFAKLGEYKQSFEKWQQATYELGQFALDEKRYQDADELFEALGDYEDSKKKLSEAMYLKAGELYDSGLYTVAKGIYDSLGDYESAAYKSSQCVYMQGKASFDAGDYAAAADTLFVLGDFEDADELVKRSNYELGAAADESGDLLKASEYYLAAGDYEGAADKANDSLYRHGQALAAQEQWEEAAQVFARIIGYSDSESRAAMCAYRQAKLLADTGDYTGASALLATVAARDEEAEKLYRETNYALAKQAAEAGDDVLAESLFASVPDYEDSEKQLKTVRYRLAEKDMASGDYQSALARFESLGEYEDSGSKAEECAYKLAEKQLDAGDYSAAADAFAALGAYGDSALRMNEAIYRLALKTHESGDNEQALELLEGITGHAEADKLRRDITMNEAARLVSEGELDEASRLYLSINDDAEALEGYNSSRYALADGLAASGDYAAACNEFILLGDYSDSTARAEQCAESAYGEAAQTARAAWEKNDYAAVVAALDGMEFEALPANYADLAETYREACYREAERLYGEDKPYEALPYYTRIADYKDVADKKLNRRAYLILGDWKSATNKTASFRADGTCDIMGEELYFRVSNFSLYTGKMPDSMTVTHNLSTIDEKSMGIRDMRDGNKLYKLLRVNEAEFDSALPDLEEAEETAEDADMLVAEE